MHSQKRKEETQLLPRRNGRIVFRKGSVHLTLPFGIILSDHDEIEYVFPYDRTSHWCQLSIGTSTPVMMLESMGSFVCLLCIE